VFNIKFIVFTDFRKQSTFNLSKFVQTKHKINNLYAEVTFDFDEQFLLEKENFLDYLSNEKWTKLDTDQIWRIGFKNNIIPEDKLKFILNDLEIATKVSNIKAVDYAIMIEDIIYIDTIK